MATDIDTIVALATPVGRAGIGVLRVSGPKALSIAEQLIKKADLAAGKIHYCAVYNRMGELMDKGIVLYFQAPHSFTGEDVIEIQGHGAPVLLDAMIQECIFYGARLAQPGEYSLRAYLNNKMDLAQAEAVADLIASDSLTAAKMALSSLQGHFSDLINELAQEILHLRLFVEAAIDFPEEEINFFDDGKVGASVDAISQSLKNICLSTSQGVLMREGLSVVIAGRPNAGKSTLINYFAGRDIAIVTDIAGTTRDVLREHIDLDGLPVHIIDTAGLRESQDVVEQAGIRRAWKEVETADCVLLIRDINVADPEDGLCQNIKDRAPKDVPLLTVFNKIDASKLAPKRLGNTLYLSAKTGEGMGLLKHAIQSAVGFRPAEGKFMARRRHLDALNRAQDYIRAAQLQIIGARAFELVAEDLRQAHLALCEITGEFTADDLLGEIFSSFCIGK